MIPRTDGAALLLLAAGCAAVPPAAGPAVAAVPATPAVPSAPVPAAAFRIEGDAVQGGLIRGAAPEGAVAVTLDGVPLPLADGRFILGFDRDAPPEATLTARFADGDTLVLPIAVAPRAWDVSRLSTLPRYPVPAPAFARLRPPELAAIEAARRRATDATGWRQAMIWPTTGRISTRFGSQRIYRNGEAGAYHSGIDIARPAGTPVVAPADGIVVLAADHPFTLEGNLLMIDHGMGLGSALLHLSRIDVAVGDHVRQGHPVGLVGATGRATGAHLHWGLRWRDARLDPLLAAGTMPS